LFSFLRRFLLHASIWMLVFISFDRFTFVLYERRFRFMKNRLILSSMIFGLMFALAILDVENFFYYTYGSSKSSLLTCMGTNSITLAADLISLFLRIYIPMPLMLIFNGLMIYRLVKSSRSSQLVARKSSQKRREYQFTLAVMSCCLLYFISNFPISVFYIFFDVYLYSGTFKNDSTLSVEYSFYLNVFLNCAFILQTLSIFVYLGFNKLFRKEFCFMFFSFLFCKPPPRGFRSESSLSQSFSKRNDQSSLSVKT
jgi:hypothetical protein